MLRGVQDVSGLLQLAVNMQQEGAAQQLLHHITRHKATSPQVAVLHNLLHVKQPGSGTSAEQQHDDAHAVAEQLEQRQQRSVALINRLLQVAVLRGHCKLAQQLAKLPAATLLQPEHLVPLLHQTMQLYDDASTTTQAPEPGDAATAAEAAAPGLFRCLRSLPCSSGVGSAAVAALLRAAVNLQEWYAADTILYEVTKMSSAHAVAVDQFAAITEAAIQAELCWTSELLQLTPATLLTSQQVAVLLHAAVRSLAASIHSPDAVFEAATLLCELPAALDIDVDTAEILLLEDAILGCGMLSELCQGVPAAQLLPAHTVQQLLVCAVQSNHEVAIVYLAALAAAQELTVGQVQQLLAAAVQLDSRAAVKQLFDEFVEQAAVVNGAALVRLAVELGKHEALQVRQSLHGAGMNLAQQC
jgi:hypothetical protein